VATAAVGVGILARLGLAWWRPLWLDEGIALAIARDPGHIIEATLARDLHPPLFAALSVPWAQPALPAALFRLPSVLVGLGTIAASAIAARAWGGRGWVGAAVAACSAPQILYSAEARPYALAMFAVATVLALSGPEALDGRERPPIMGVPAPTWDGLRQILLPMIAVIAPFTTHGAGLVTVILLLIIAWLQPSQRGVTVFPALVLGSLATAADQLAFAIPQRAAAGDALLDGFLAGDFAARLVPEALLGAFGAATADHVAWALVASGSSTFRPLGVAALVALVAGAVFGNRSIRLLVPALIAIWVAFFALSVLGLHPYGGIRQLAPVVPILCTILAVHLSSGRATLLLAPVCAAGLAAALVGPGLPVEDQPALLALLRGRVKDGDVLYIDAAAGPGFGAYAPLGWRGKSQTLPWADGAALPHLRPPELGSAWVITTRIHPKTGDVLGERWKFSRVEVLVAPGVRAEHWIRPSAPAR
jgi:hypothetical protein